MAASHHGSWYQLLVFDLRHVHVAIGPLVLVFAIAALLPQHTSIVFSVGGSALQIAGLATVFWVLTGELRHHGKPLSGALKAAATKWADRVYGKAIRRPPHVVELRGTAAGTSSMVGDLSVEMGLKNLSTTRQVMELERRIREQRDRLQKLSLRVSSEVARIDQSLQEQSRDLKNLHAHVDEELVRSSIGGWGWAFSGAFLTFSGLVLNAWPQLELFWKGT